MSLEQIGFKRMNTIKELFNPFYFLNNFTIVEFEGLRGFIDSLENDFLMRNGNIWIHITSQEEFLLMKQMIIETIITDQANILLFIDFNIREIKEDFQGIEPKRFQIVISSNQREGLLELENTSFNRFKVNNPVYLQYNVNFENINTIFEEMIQNYQENMYRFIYIYFDYISFEKATFEDIHNIRFKINRLSSFMQTSSGKQKIEILNGRELIKKIYVANDLSLWYNERHYIDNYALFDNNRKKVKQLFQLDTFHKSGEDIPLQILNYLHQYMDITIKTIVSEMNIHKNFLYIDYYQNKLIQGNILEIPYICQLILEWLQV